VSDTHAGGCACGALRYQVHGKPVVATVCHCTFCQRRLASAFALLASFPEECVEVTRGEVAEFEHRSDESGRWLRMSYCPQCGTTVSHIAQLRPRVRTIAGGTFDDPSWFTVNRHIWVRSKLPWVTIPPGVEAFELGAIASSQVTIASDKP
jgi:hypothetical protein